MDMQTLSAPTRRPRFRRASEPPAFRLTDDDVVIVRQLARYRFLRSTHIAALVGRSNFEQTGFEKKMRAYLTAHAAKQHEQRFGWKTFRVLTITTDENRKQSVIDALRRLHVAHAARARRCFSSLRAPNCARKIRSRICGAMELVVEFD